MIEAPLFAPNCPKEGGRHDGPAWTLRRSLMAEESIIAQLRIVALTMLSSARVPGRALRRPSITRRSRTHLSVPHAQGIVLSARGGRVLAT